MSSDVVKEGAELLKLAMASDKKGKKGDKAKQLDAAIMYLQAQRLFTRAAGRESPDRQRRCPSTLPPAALPAPALP